MPVLPGIFQVEIYGNYDKTQNYKCNYPGTCFTITEYNVIINIPMTAMQQLIADNNTNHRVIGFTSTQYDRYNGFHSYVDWLVSNGYNVKLVLPELCTNTMDLNVIKYPWDNTLYRENPKYNHIKVADDISKYTTEYASSDLYNEMVKLGNNQKIYVEQRIDHIFTMGYINLRPNTCEKIMNYAIVLSYVTQDNTTKELVVIVDFRFNNLIHDFILAIKDNYTKLSIAWYHDPNNDDTSNKITDNQINTYVDTSIRSNIVKVDNNDSTLIGSIL